MRPETSSPLRAEVLSRIRSGAPVDVLIIGGGINGTGLLRELALQGVDVLLAEQGDYGSGCSAASTRIIHGGLRYLENGEFRLVRESLQERERLLRNAPHYVRPLPTTIPIMSWGRGIGHAARKFFGLPSKPGDRGAAVIKAGLELYDLLAGPNRQMPRHRFHLRRAALAERPELNPNIVCAATYYDAKISYAERLCLELVLDASAAHAGASALNYARVTGADGDAVHIQDMLGGEALVVHPSIVVNASGPWIDFTNRALRAETDFIGGTKGAHLVIDHPELHRATGGHMLYFANADGRICIFYPVEDRVIVGSTDLPTDDAESVCSDEETDYLLASVRQVFPSIQLDRSHIVFTFSGVRPLPTMAAITPGQISRDHSAPRTEPEGVNFPVYSLVGGKWTTFRAFAQQVTDQLLAELGRERRASSIDLPIGGGRDYPRRPEDRDRLLEAWHVKTGLPREQLARLLERYGTRGREVAAYCASAPDRPLQHVPGYSERELAFIAEHEQVGHLDDLLLRRTLLGLLGRCTVALIEECAATVGPVLGWDAARIRDEIHRTIDLLERRHGMALRGKD
ncbi:MAG: glycerol-3-phosphate dehydrogenase/oxidase [Aggregatilineales bacterium]